MESLKDLASKKALNIFSFIIFGSWIIACCILAGVFILIEIGESKSDIRCDAEFNDKDEKELIREKCFDKYQEEYSKLPVFGFVFINCFILAMVPIIYSLCLKSRVDKLETSNQNVNRQPQQRRVLFTAYCCQLAATIVLATVFIIVLQTRAFHASTNFPSHFECNLLKQDSNSSAFSSTNGSQEKTDIYPCRNRRATKKCYGSVALTIFNGIWAFLAFIELFWILSRARNDAQFMDDSQFYVDHLRSNREQEPSDDAVPLSAPRSTRDFGKVSARSLSLMRSERPPEQQPELQAEFYADHSRSNCEQEQQQQQSEEAVLLPALRSTRDLREVGARSLPEQHVVIELIPPTRSERTPEQQAEPNNSNLEQSSQVVVPLSYLRSTRDFEEVNARSLPEQQLLIEPTPLTRSERMPEQRAKLQTELYADYLRCNCEQEPRPQQSEEAVLLPESDLRSTRDLREVGARSLPEQHVVIELIPPTRSERTPEQQAEPNNSNLEQSSQVVVPLSYLRSTRDFEEVNARSLPEQQLLIEPTPLTRSERMPEQRAKLQTELYADYLRCNCEQEPRPQQSEEAVLLPESDLRSTRDLREVGARSLPEQHVVIEPILPTRSERTPEQQAEPNNSNLEQSSQVVVPLSDLRSTRNFKEVNARSLTEQQRLIEPTPPTRSERTPEQQAKLQAKFYADHLRSNCEQEQRPQLSEEAVLPPESDLRFTRDSGEVSARSLPEQRPVVEPTPLTRSERIPEKQAELQAKLESLKDYIKKCTERPEDLNQPIRSRPGEGQKPKVLELDQIFVKLVIHDCIAKYDFPQDRKEQLKVFPKPQSSVSNYVSWKEIIDGNNKHILLVGRPGIGKTILSTKLLRGSAFNEFTPQNFDAAFLMKFRHYNSTKENLLDLRELLSRSETVSQDLDDEVWNYIITNPTKVLMIFDGIDEFNAKSAISKKDSHFKNSKEEKMPLHCLYKKIASGKLLEGATVITTSRPTASSYVRQLNPDRVLEILGFTSEEVEAYVTSFTKEDQNPRAEKTAIWEHISTNINLFTLCYVPVNCFIICSCLSWLRSLGIRLPTKLTEIYSVALKIFYFRHSDKYRMNEEAHDQFFLKPFHELPTECKEEFQRLGKLAFDGIKDGRLLFASKEVEGLEDCGLLHRLPDLPSQDGIGEGKAQYCFIHLTFQEFLAAKHVVDTMTEEQALHQFITDHIHEGPWQLVVQFVAGSLVDTKKQQFCEILMELLPMSTFEAESQLGQDDAQPRMTEKPTAFICWPHGESEANLAVTICKCLYELDIKEQSSIKRKMKEISFDKVFLVYCNLAPADCRAILHFLKNHDKKFTLFLKANYMGDLSCLEFKNWISESDFCRGGCNLVGLSFAVNNITDEGVGYLCKALESEKCSLTVLVLSSNDIGHKGAKLLSDAIKVGNCKLTRLDLEATKIGVEGVEHLIDALKYVNNNLTELNLAFCKIPDKGAEYLSAALKDVHCKLTLLNLAHNFIGDKGAEYLGDALKDVHCKLTLLNLTQNYVGDKGAEYLSDALKDVHCKLTLLNLALNFIGDKGAKYLSDALKDEHCKLTLLNLTHNYVGDKGAEYLSDALKDVHCKLTLLNLTQKYVEDKGAEYLSDALKDLHHRLSELEWALIYFGHKGAEYLSDALEDLQHKLALLNLAQNDVGEKGAEYLSDALKDLQHKLTLLNLAQKEFRDIESEYFRDALKDVYGKLYFLNQIDSYFGGEHLHDAVKDLHHRLFELEWALNYFGDKGAEYLSDALKDLPRRLLKLEQALNYFVDIGAENLSDALKDLQHKLALLNLAQNDVKRAEYLSDVLKDLRHKFFVPKLRRYLDGYKRPERPIFILKDLHHILAELKLALNDVGDK